MSTRSLQFFMTQEEFSDLIHQITTKLLLCPILKRFRPDRKVEIGDATAVMSDGKLADIVFLTSEKPDPESLLVFTKEPGKRGCVVFYPPRSSEKVLYLSTLGTKSDWYDELSGQILDNPQALDLFNRIKPSVKKRLRRPMWVAFPGLDEQKRLDQRTWYSEGIVEWVQRGGHLKQEGTRAEFYISDSDD